MRKLLTKNEQTAQEKIQRYSARPEIENNEGFAAQATTNDAKRERMMGELAETNPRT